MSRDFWFGLALLPALALALAVLAGAALIVTGLYRRFAPSHWHFTPPRLHRRAARNASDLLRFVNVSGGHARTVRPLGRYGPFGVWLIRYTPGHVEERERERIP